MKHERVIKEVEFTCDNCKKKSGYNAQVGSCTNIIDLHPFPYKANWVYVYEFGIKILGKKIIFGDAHFCCHDCFREYVQKQIDKVYDEELKRRNAHGGY